MVKRMKSVFFFLCGFLIVGGYVLFVYHPVSVGAAIPTNSRADLYQRKAIIALPAMTANWNFDGGYVDSQRHILYQSDVTNKQVDVISLSTHKLVSTLSGFTGSPDPTGYDYSHNGPNHVIGIPGFGSGATTIVVSNGDSSVRFFDVSNPNHPTFLSSVSTGGSTRVDAMAYDPLDHILAVVNGGEMVPFISFLDVHTEKIVAQLHFDGLSGYPSSGLDDIEFDAASNHFYLSYTGTMNHDPYGAILEIALRIASPVSIKPVILHAYHIPYAQCDPSGIAIIDRSTLHHDVAIACGGNPLILHVVDGEHSSFSMVKDCNSGDFVATDGRVFAFAEYGNVSGSELVLADPAGNVLQAIPTAAISHAVTADEENGSFYVPEAGQGVVVFGREE